MSEGNGAANGGSAPTTPAPGVSSNPTPKSGEGAVVPKPQGALESPKFQPIKRKLKFGDGSEEEYEVSSEEELDRMRLGQKLADKANKKALDLERKEKARKEALAKKDYSVLKDLGFDADAFFQEKLQAELRREQMSAEDRAKEDHDNRVKQAEARAQAAERKAAAIEQQIAEEKEWAGLQPRLGASMREAGMLDDTHAWEEVARVAQDFLEQGLDVPPEVVIKEAAERDKKKFDERLSKVTREHAPSLWAKLPPDVRKAFGYLAAQEHIKAKTNIPAPTEAVPKQVEVEKKEQPVPMSIDRWLRSVR